MEKNGVTSISRVDQTTAWCAGMVVVPKPSGKIRICIDLSKLNENVTSENFPLQAIEQSLGLLSGGNISVSLMRIPDFSRSNCQIKVNYSPPLSLHSGDKPLTGYRWDFQVRVNTSKKGCIKF